MLQKHRKFRRKLQAENKGCGCQRNSEGERKKMFSLNHLTFFEEAVKNREHGYGNAADNYRDKCSEKRADEKE